MAVLETVDGLFAPEHPWRQGAESVTDRKAGPVVGRSRIRMTNLRMLLDELAKAEAELADLTSAHARLEARIDELRRGIATARKLTTEHVIEPISSAATPATSVHDP